MRVRKRIMSAMPRLAAAVLAYWCCAAGPALSQCDPDQNAYVYLHPVFANKNWTYMAYDSVLVLTSDSLCNLRPALFDMCGTRDNAFGVFFTRNRDLFMVKSPLTCSGGCVPCMLEYLDPSRVGLNGVSVSPASPLYLPKNTALYGGAVVKVLFATSQKQVLALSVSTADQSIVKRDTLALTALTAGQEIVRIQGDYDTTTRKDVGVWVLGSQGLVRYFTLVNDAWGAEAKRDLAVADTVFCAGFGYAGTSFGTIYRRNAGGAFVLDSKPVSSAITNIYPRGAVGKNGTVLENSGGTWISRQTGTGDYWYGNFANRWDGAGVELIDSSWRKTTYTYRNFPSSIVSTSPFVYSNNMVYTYRGPATQAVTVTMADPDNSYTDFGLSLRTGGTNVNMKSDGAYTIQNIPGSTICPKDSIRLRSGTIVCTLMPQSIQVTAECMRGQYVPLCQSYSWTDYHFVASHSWRTGDTLTVTTGSNRLRIADTLSAVTTITGDAGLLSEAGQVSHRMVGGSLVFSVRQGSTGELARIVLYNVKGQTLCAIPVGKQNSITVQLPPAAGIVYARYVFGDGRSSSQNIVLLR
jgi:hypothetical protein